MSGDYRLRPRRIPIAVALSRLDSPHAVTAGICNDERPSLRRLFVDYRISRMCAGNWTSATRPQHDMRTLAFSSACNMTRGYRNRCSLKSCQPVSTITIDLHSFVVSMG